MTVIAGASRYLGAATLANQQGIAPSTPNVLGANGTALNPTGLLDSARLNTGIGVSASSRALNNTFLNQSRSGFNKVFSLNGVEFGTTETLVQKIAAIRASIPESRLDESVRGDAFDSEA